MSPSATLTPNAAARWVGGRRFAPGPRVPSTMRLPAFSGMRTAGAADGLGSSRTSVASISSARAARPARRGLVVTAVFEKFTERAIKAVILAQEEAKQFGSAETCSEHILLGLISEDSSKEGYLGTGMSLERAQHVVGNMNGVRKRRKEGDVKPRELPFSRDAKRVFEAAMKESRLLGMNFIAPEHIAVALFSVGDVGAKRTVARMGIDTEDIKNEAHRRLRGEQQAAAGEAGRTKRRRSKKEDEKPSALEEFARDLCADAAAGIIDPIIGRQDEVMRVTQILARRTKNNPILLGEPGVGKTAIAEGLALSIVTGECTDGSKLPEFLVGKRIMQLDVGLLIAGAKERGELEQRVTRLLAECREDKNIILMIDEVHTLVGAGAVGRGGGGGLDVSNLFKPALARGELQCIGATTLDEHRKHIERDAALERRFQPVTVAEPTTDQTLAILRGLQERYERHHRCVYEPSAVEAAVSLSEKYIADRFLPDKAIDLLDEAGSRARIAAYMARKEAGMEDYDSAQVYAELASVIEAKEESVRDHLYEEATLLRERELELKDKLVGEPEEGNVVPRVDIHAIENIVSTWTGIPAERMSEDDLARLAGLDNAIGDRLLGQNDAINATVAAIRRARSGLKDPSRPVATLMFCGPTGVGKTQLTKVLSEQYFGSEDALIRFDMSEYMERHTVSKLIGAPPGYVGFGEGGKLTEAVRRRPFSIILLDEIEKAHPDVFNILLQVIEDGRLTDSQGRVVSFRNALIIATSNVGSQVISKGGNQLGFAVDNESAEDRTYGRIKNLVHEELKHYFRPEFLNRLDEIVVFRPLQREHIRSIADLMLAETGRLMAARGIGLAVSDNARDRLAEEGFDELLGARPLRRVITHLLEDAVSDAVLQGELHAGDTAHVDINSDGDVVIRTTPPVEADTERVYVSPSGEVFE